MMSTCPDSDLYSAYIDGEVPSPWREKLEAHIASCPRCKALAERFSALHRAVSSGQPSLQKAELEASWARLCARREIAVAAIRSRRERRAYPDWTRVSVRLPLPALAAMLLVVLALPVWFTFRDRSGGAEGGQFNTLSDLAAARAGISPTLTSFDGSSTVYSPDLPTTAIQTEPLDPDSRMVYQMINYARTFVPEEEALADNARIIIIKLPDLKHLHTTDEFQLPSGTGMLQAAGFSR
jgi:hypothetical protein